MGASVPQCKEAVQVQVQVGGASARRGRVLTTLGAGKPHLQEKGSGNYYNTDILHLLKICFFFSGSEIYYNTEYKTTVTRQEVVLVTCSLMTVSSRLRHAWQKVWPQFRRRGNRCNKS